jgi:hypothetical protein
MSRFFSFKYLAVMVLVVASIVGIGNAAAFTFTSSNQNVVEGQSNAFVAENGAVTYAINSDGDVQATIVTTDTYTLASASLTGAAGSYQPCTTAANQIVCDFPNADLAAGDKLYIVATAD